MPPTAQARPSACEADRVRHLGPVWSEADGSSTSCANRTARQAASGRLAHQRCNVDGCPCPIDFSRTLSLVIPSSGIETSMSFLRDDEGDIKRNTFFVLGCLGFAFSVRDRRSTLRLASSGGCNGVD